MKPIVLPLLSVMLCEVGTALMMLNAAPHQPLGFWLWFGSLAFLGPVCSYWLYRRLVKHKA